MTRASHDDQIDVQIGRLIEQHVTDPDFAAFLLACGIDSISLNPDGFVAAARRVAETEAAR